MTVGDGVGSDGMTSGAAQKKKNKARGSTHGLHYEILDDPNIKAESGWETETAEYWTSTMCKKYVKMYHIGKLWPRDCHAAHNHDYACRPWTCKSKHFVHRSTEVWGRLFGQRAMCKGRINYSLASMVYAELILARKIDWSTFPTMPGCAPSLEGGQKDIPDLFHPLAEQTEPSKSKKVLKNTTTQEMKVLEGTSGAIQLGPSSTTPPQEVPNASLESVEGEVFSTPPTTLMCTPNVTIAIEESNAPNENNLLNKGKAPSTSRKEVTSEKVARAYATIDNLIDSKVLENVTYDALNCDLATTSSPILSPPIEEHPPHTSEVQVDDMLNNSTLDGGEMERRYPHLATLSKAEQQFLSQMPNAKEIERMLECHQRWEAVGGKFIASKSDNQGNEAGSSSASKCGTGMANFVRTAFNLACSAQVVAEMTPMVNQMAEEFSQMSPKLLDGALSFYKFTESLEPFLDERVDQLKTLLALEEENNRLKNVDEENCLLKDQLRMSTSKIDLAKKREEQQSDIIVRQQSDVQSLEKRIKELEGEVVELLAKGAPMSKKHRSTQSMDPSQESDKLSLPFEKALAMEAVAKSDSLNVDEVADNHKWEVAIRPVIRTNTSTFQDASMQKQGNEMIEVKELKQSLKEAVESNKKLQCKLDRLERIVQLKKSLKFPNSEPRWLTWIQKLEDKSFVISQATKGLLRLAMKSEDEYKHVESSYWRLQSMFTEHPTGSTEITCWGDMEAMFERLNHTKNEKSPHINWTLEVEEGWVPYSTLSAHIQKHEKTVVHGCGTSPVILEGHCSICQLHFGPEGALTMGQCPHTFHVTCLVKACLVRSVCPECRSPFSPRFYEMLGLLEGMPPGHEYNRWNLPLDQGPYHFQNYQHWGKPLSWDSVAQTHALYEVSEQPLDPFLWMTFDKEVELRARGIEDDEVRELFCRSMGGHWSMQHKKFFRFPEKEVQKGPDGNWREVERTQEFNEQYGSYNHTLIGRALFLSKLEEAARIRAIVDTGGQSSTDHALLDVAQAFDRRMRDIIHHWRVFLVGGEQSPLLYKEDDDEAVKVMISKVDGALRALKAHEVDLSPQQRNKRKREDNDDFSPDTKRQFQRVDMEATSGRPSVGGSPRPTTRRVSARLLALEGSSRDVEEGNGDRK